MMNSRKLLLVNDKEYKLHASALTCAVNYNEFFLPLKEHFDEVHILGRLNPSPGTHPFAVPGVVFHGMPMYETYTEFVRRYRFGPAGREARNVLAQAIRQCDVVLLTLGCFFAREVEKLCLRLNKPLIIEVIDDVVTSVSETRKYRGLSRLVALAMARKVDRYYRRLCARFPSLILGKTLFQRYRPAAGPKCVEFFENIMEERQYRFDRRLFADETVKVLFVGRLVHMKAVEDLISAVAILRDLDVAIECRIIGYGDCLHALRRQVRDHDLESQVTFSGFVKYGDEMFSAYDWADIFVLPSVGGEGVPRVLIEALGRGCLVVASDVCGVSTIIKDGVTGKLVPPRRPDLIADTMQFYASSPEATEKLLFGAKEFCLQHTRSKQIQRLVDFIEAAMRERS